MTDESASQTDPWIEKHGAEFAYAYYKGSDLPRFARVQGIPRAILIDPSGEVVWAGHPARLSGADIEKHLEGAFPVPLWDFPKEASKVKSALQKDNLFKALEASKALVSEGADMSSQILAAVETTIESRVGKVRTANELGDFLTVVEKGDAASKALGKLPQATVVDAIVDKVRASKEAKEIVKAQRKVRDLAEDAAEMRKKVEADKLSKKLQKIASDHEGSYAATQANELLDEIRKKRPKLR